MFPNPLLLLHPSYPLAPQGNTFSSNALWTLHPMSLEWGGRPLSSDQVSAVTALQCTRSSASPLCPSDLLPFRACPVARTSSARSLDPPPPIPECSCTSGSPRARCGPLTAFFLAPLSCALTCAHAQGFMIRHLASGLFLESQRVTNASIAHKLEDFQ